MTTLTEWAITWDIPQPAVDELIALIKHDTPDKPPPDTKQPADGEHHVQQAVRLEASQAGGRLWRNNVGAFKPDNGGYVRYGLCNDSAQLNKQIKSSDLIGIRPVLIRPEHVGRVFGVFVAREVKHGLWTFTGKTHERAQLKFLELVLSMGGDACFTVGKGTICANENV